MLVVTPTNREVHVFIDVAVESESVLTIVESPATFKAGVAATTPQNVNRSSSVTPGTITRRGVPFGAGSGTTIGSFYVAAGSGPLAGGGGVGNTFHEIFASGTTYGIHVANAGNAQVSINIEFYESFA